MIEAVRQFLNYLLQNHILNFRMREYITRRNDPLSILMYILRDVVFGKLLWYCYLLSMRYYNYKNDHILRPMGELKHSWFWWNVSPYCEFIRVRYLQKSFFANRWSYCMVKFSLQYDVWSSGLLFCSYVTEISTTYYRITIIRLFI